MCDFGLNINLKLSFIFKNIGLDSPHPTTIVLQLEDRFLARLEGIIKNVLVNVGCLFFLIDFIILDVELDLEVPFILGYLIS